MGNSTSNRLMILDTLGVISERPMRIWKVLLFPNAASDAATFVSWGNVAKATQYLKTCTVTSNSIITSTANDFEAAEVAVLDVINIFASSTGNNLGTHLVVTRGGDTNITTSGVTLTNDVAATYSWKTITPYTSVYIKTEGASGAVTPYEIDFGLPGLWVPNLAYTVKSTSAIVHIYQG